MYFNNRIPGNRLADESTTAAQDGRSLDWVAMACSREHLEPGRFGAQIYAAVDDGEIDLDTASTLVRTFLGGGVDTTVLALGSLIRLLATHPLQWEKLCGQPDLARAAFDETLRLAPPAPMVGRTTTGATELGGVTLGAREKVFLLVGAANRDPRRWDHPDDFDITRNVAAQLAFGLGPHFCVGHAVARLEVEVVLTALIERVERIEVCGEQEPELNNWLYGLRHLPVTVTARA
jgi:cytochrome P450